MDKNLEDRIIISLGEKPESTENHKENKITKCWFLCFWGLIYLLIIIIIIHGIFPPKEKYGTSSWTPQCLTIWTAVFSLAILWSSYNKRQQTADGVAARQQPQSLFFTEGLTKLRHLQHSPWWIFDRVLLSFLDRMKKTKPVDGDTKPLVLNFHFYATSNVHWNSGRAKFLFSPSLSTASCDSLKACWLQRCFFYFLVAHNENILATQAKYSKTNDDF